jgi:hypothetical protein
VKIRDNISGNLVQFSFLRCDDLLWSCSHFTVAIRWRTCKRGPTST